MRIITLDENTLDIEGYYLKPEIPYIIEDQSVAQYANLVNGKLMVHPFLSISDDEIQIQRHDFFRKFKQSFPPAHNNKVLILRSGAAGDLLFATPALEKLAETKEVTVACMPRFHWIFKRHPKIKLMNFPCLMGEDYYSFDKVINVEYCDAEKQGQHMVDSFAKRLGVELTQEERIPKWQIDPELLQKMQELYPRKEGIKRIAFCFQSMAVLRDYPLKKFQQVAKAFYRYGHEVFLLGPPNSLITDEKLKQYRLFNLTELGHSWEEQVTCIKTCDVFCGNDSGNTHFASAMSVPTVALYGPIHWRDRSGVWPNVLSIQGHGDCAPCYHHPTGNQPWPKDKPCEKSGKCEVLNGIEVERVISKIKSLL